MKKKFLILIGLLLTAYLIGYFIFKPQTNPNATGPSLTQDQITQIQNTVKESQFKGTVTVYKDRKKAWQLTTANNPNSAYLINSTQKILTAGLVMQQVDAHKLDLNAKLNQFYPNIPGGDKISVMNLLEMTSGLTASALGNSPYQNDDDNVNKLISSLNFDQSKLGQWNYQDVNYALLSHILEKATGQSYEQLFNNMYTDPLKLKHTGFMWNDDATKNRIQLAPATKPVDMNAVHGLLGAGSVAMSNDDLYNTTESLLDEKLLSDNSRVVIYGTGNNSPHYRGGFYDNGSYFSANGAGYNYFTFLRISKDGKDAVIFQTNTGGNFNDLSNKITQIYKNIAQ